MVSTRARRVVHDRLRHDDALESAGSRRACEVLRLLAVVELAQERLAELLEHLSNCSGGRPRCARRGTRRFHASASRSSTICSRMPGRCTLTATGRPSRSAARCTCPSDAAASGVGFEARERLRDADAQLLRDDALDVREGERFDLVLQPRERLEVRAAEDVGAGREELTELDEGGSRVAPDRGASSSAFGSRWGALRGKTSASTSSPLARSPRPYFISRTAMSL